MASDARFGVDDYGAATATEPKRKGSGCLKGCLIVFVVLLVLAVILGFIAFQYGPPWLMKVAAEGLNQAIDQSDLPAQEKIEVKEQITRISTEFREGRLSYAQLGLLFQNLTQSPLMTSIIVSVVDKQYLDRSGLPDEEKAEGRTTIRRFVRGMVDNKIPEASINAAMEHIADRQAGGGWQMRQQVSDADLRAFFEAAKSAADAAAIPDEPEDFDPSDEIKKLIDEAMAAE